MDGVFLSAHFRSGLYQLFLGSNLSFTAVGGKYAAGIGGGDGYTIEFMGSSNTVTGGTGNVSITGGIVDAKGGAGNSSGNYAGDPIGNGGNTTAQANVTKTNAIVFENGGGTVCGDVTLAGSYTVPAGYSLHIPAGASLSGSGTLSGGETFTTENLTEDMISVPENLYYDGTDRTAELQNDLSAELNKGIEICGQTFTVSGWTLAVAKAADSDLTYTATYTNNNDNTNTFTKTITLQKSGTDLTSEGKVQTYKGDTLTKDFTASDTITVKATPTGAAPDNSAMFTASLAAPTAGQMAVYVGSTQVSEPVSADTDGNYTMTVPAADVLTKGQAGENEKFTLIVKFIGTTNMADTEAPVEVTITRNPLTEDMVTLSAASATYNGTEQKSTVTVTGLAEGTDYDITYTGDFTNAGEHTIHYYYFRTKRSEVIYAIFCGCRRLWRRAKRLKSNVLFPNFKFGNNNAPSFTKNAQKARDPEMHQTKKGNEWRFGMKCHVGVDAHSGFVHIFVDHLPELETIDSTLRLSFSNNTMMICGILTNTIFFEVLCSATIPNMIRL